MEKNEIIRRIEAGETDLTLIKKWLQCTPKEHGLQTPEVFLRGDVVFHHGLHHPIVVVEVLDNGTCKGILLTSTKTAFQVKSRFSSFNSRSYYASTITIFDPSKGTYMGTVEEPEFAYTHIVRELN